MLKKLWSGRVKKTLNPIAEKFLSSLNIDKRLAFVDITGSIAHTRMLAKCKIISAPEAEKIVRGLKETLEEFKNNRFKFSPNDEDIHTAIERRLTEKIGTVAGKMHSARSRNDQVALDERLYLKEEIFNILQALDRLQKTFQQLAKRYRAVSLPGFTHLQHAQPIKLGWYFQAYQSMFSRDGQRLEDCLKRLDFSPLGAGALAGSSLPIDRKFCARLLGFRGIIHNTIDAVSDRDFILEFLSISAILMMHLSRFGEELVLWSSPEFGFIHWDESFATGSSIMPQKLNPDIAEVMRGKTGRVYGNLVNLLTVAKALPLAYNRDLQEDKHPLFDTIDTVKSILILLPEVLPTIKFDQARMKEMLKEGFLEATEIANYLVKKGLPFRQAHHLIGRIVNYCLANKKRLAELTLTEWQKFSVLFNKDINKIVIK